MNRRLKTLLLSALVLPGLGQFVQRRYLAALPLMIASLGGMTLLVVDAVRQALEILAQIEQEGLIDPSAIVDAATRGAAGGDHRLGSLALVVVLVCWLIGVVDACFAGGKGGGERSAG